MNLDDLLDIAGQPEDILEGYKYQNELRMGDTLDRIFHPDNFRTSDSREATTVKVEPVVHDKTWLSTPLLGKFNLFYHRQYPLILFATKIDTTLIEDVEQFYDLINGPEFDLAKQSTTCEALSDEVSSLIGEEKLKVLTHRNPIVGNANERTNFVYGNIPAIPNIKLGFIFKCPVTNCFKVADRGSKLVHHVILDHPYFCGHKTTLKEAQSFLECKLGGKIFDPSTKIPCQRLVFSKNGLGQYQSTVGVDCPQALEYLANKFKRFRRLDPDVVQPDDEDELIHGYSFKLSSNVSGGANDDLFMRDGKVISILKQLVQLKDLLDFSNILYGVRLGDLIQSIFSTLNAYLSYLASMNRGVVFSNDMKVPQLAPKTCESYSGTITKVLMFMIIRCNVDRIQLGSDEVEFEAFESQKSRISRLLPFVKEHTQILVVRLFDNLMLLIQDPDLELIDEVTASSMFAMSRFGQISSDSDPSVEKINRLMAIYDPAIVLISKIFESEIGTKIGLSTGVDYEDLLNHEQQLLDDQLVDELVEEFENHVIDEEGDGDEIDEVMNDDANEREQVQTLANRIIIPNMRDQVDDIVENVENIAEEPEAEYDQLRNLLVVSSIFCLVNNRKKTIKNVSQRVKALAHIQTFVKMNIFHDYFGLNANFRWFPKSLFPPAARESGNRNRAPRVQRELSVGSQLRYMIKLSKKIHFENAGNKRVLVTSIPSRLSVQINDNEITMCDLLQSINSLRDNITHMVCNLLGVDNLQQILKEKPLSEFINSEKLKRNDEPTIVIKDTNYIRSLDAQCNATPKEFLVKHESIMLKFITLLMLTNPNQLRCEEWRKLRSTTENVHINKSIFYDKASKRFLLLCTDLKSRRMVDERQISILFIDQKDSIMVIIIFGILSLMLTINIKRLNCQVGEVFFNPHKNSVVRYGSKKIKPSTFLKTITGHLNEVLQTRELNWSCFRQILINFGHLVGMDVIQNTFIHLRSQQSTNNHSATTEEWHYVSTDYITDNIRYSTVAKASQLFERFKMIVVNSAALMEVLNPAANNVFENGVDQNHDDMNVNDNNDDGNLEVHHEPVPAAVEMEAPNPNGNDLIEPVVEIEEQVRSDDENDDSSMQNHLMNVAVATTDDVEVIVIESENEDNNGEEIIVLESEDFPTTSDDFTMTTQMGEAGDDTVEQTSPFGLWRSSPIAYLASSPLAKRRRKV